MRGVCCCSGLFGRVDVVGTCCGGVRDCGVMGSKGDPLPWVARAEGTGNGTVVGRGGCIGWGFGRMDVGSVLRIGLLVVGGGL